MHAGILEHVAGPAVARHGGDAIAEGDCCAVGGEGLIEDGRRVREHLIAARRADGEHSGGGELACHLGHRSTRCHGRVVRDARIDGDVSRRDPELAQAGCRGDGVRSHHDGLNVGGQAACCRDGLEGQLVQDPAIVIDVDEDHVSTPISLRMSTT